MTTLREQMTVALQTALTGVTGLPPTCPRDLADPRTEDYALFGDVATDSHFLTLLDEGVKPREGCAPLLGGDEVLSDWDLTLVAAYSVRSSDPATRIAQRDAGVAAIRDAVLPPDGVEPARHRLTGLANWMWIQAPELRADSYDAGVLLAVARVPLLIWFSANDPND